MGVRPFIKIVTGLVYSEKLHREEIKYDPEPMIPALIEDKFNLLTGKHKDYDDVCLYDVFHYGPPYSSSLDKPEGVIGYVADEIHDQPITRALFAMWEREILDDSLHHQEYQWPQELQSDRDRRLRQAKWGTERARKVTELAYNENRMYQYFCGSHGEMSSDTWFKCALHVLHQAGFTQVGRGDLQTYLVFGWN